MPKSKKDGVTLDLTSLKSKKFKAHLAMRATGISEKSKLIKKAAVAQKLPQRKDDAAAARVLGATFAYPMGGSYTDVAKFDKAHRSDLYMEANHTPAEDAYVGTPYEGVARGDRPAHSMLFYHHRNPRGELGGASSTGGSGVNKAWSAEKIRKMMEEKRFGDAMYQDMIDLMNTTYPNRGFYALALWRAALYAKRVGLIDGSGLEKIAGLLADFLPVAQMSEAFADRDVAVEE
jgi:hypothetical protein